MNRAMADARKKKCFTQQELSDKSGISIKSIESYESGKHEPRLYNLVCLADALEISIDEYIGRCFK